MCCVSDVVLELYSGFIITFLSVFVYIFAITGVQEFSAGMFKNVHK